MKKKVSRFFTICQEIILLLVYCANSEPTVQIGKTQIIGRTVQLEDYEVNQYLGIPYAKPPVGKLRFKKTVRLSRLPKVLNATNQAPACHQYRENPYPWYRNASQKSEDCLYLNIWTPADASPRNKKAVLYWIYGGGFRHGAIRDDIYSAEALAAFGDIIVVTANYRLGLFGFLTTNTKAAPGNAALWDMLEGLKWTNKYIGHFGGDKARITLAGESVGSVSVGLLSISRKAKGLYKQLIMESGSPLLLLAQTKPLNLALTQALAKQVGCATDTTTVFNRPRQTTKCLKEVSVEALIRAEFQLFGSNSFDFLPQYGDDLLPDNPRNAIVEENFRCDKVLIGNNKDEGSLFLIMLFPEIFGSYGKKNAHINQTMAAELVEELIDKISYLSSMVQSPLPGDTSPKTLPDIQPTLLPGVTPPKQLPNVQPSVLSGLPGPKLPSGMPDLKSLVDNVLEGVPQDAYDMIRYQLYQLLGDFVQVCPDEYYAEKCAERGGNVYFYLFVHRPSISPYAPWMGVTHFDEVQFVFGQPARHPHLYQPEEIVISKEIIKQWSSFVKTGVPDKTWPLYSRASPDYKILGGGNTTKKYRKGLHKRNCELIRPFFTLL